MKAIETAYKGYRFRSRLEARWAIFFDALGIKWEYEPEGYDLGDAGYYLPDFFLPACGAYVEVKPTTQTIEWKKILGLASEFPVLICVGRPGETPALFVDKKCPVTFPALFAEKSENFALIIRGGAERTFRAGEVVFKGVKTTDFVWEKGLLCWQQASVFAKQARFEHGETPGGWK